MNGYNFTDRVRQSLAMAREEASRLHHEYVGTEHILLGLLLDGKGVASAVLDNLRIDPNEIRAKVHGIVKSGKSAQTTGPDLPYTSRAKKVLECSMSESREMGHMYVGTEHLLLGLLREEKGIGAQVLVDAGLTLAKARAETLTILGTATPGVREALPKVHMEKVDLAGTFPTRVNGGAPVLTVAAVLSWLIGLMLIFDPKHFEARMGLGLDDGLATIAQAQGAILIGLGFINWLMRRVRDRDALIAVYYGNFVVQAVSFAVVLRALVHGFIPSSGVGALLLHVLLGAAFAWQMMRVRRG